MKLKSILLLPVAAVTMHTSFAQATWVHDSVTMGTSYANDIYYSLSNGVAKTEPNNNWDFAFSAIGFGQPHYGVGVWANEAIQSGTPCRVYSLKKGVSSFASITGADTVGITSSQYQLHNSDVSYADGAFNQNAGGAGQYGWGTYNPGDHNVYGDSVYLVIKGTEAYKMMIEKYNSTPPISWKFHIQKLDGSSPVDVVTIPMASYANRVFAYYAIGSGDLDREPNVNSWDIHFTRYAAPIQMGPGAPVPYPSTGVLANPNVSMAEVRHVDADTTQYFNYPRSNDNISVIGRDWKKSTFNTTTQEYDLDTVTYFIETPDQKIYQIEFTKATTSTGQGKIAFRKRFLTNLSVPETKTSVNRYYVAPNPAQNDVQIMLDANDADNGAKVILTDINGRTMQQYTVDIKKGLNAYAINVASVPAGMYLVHITNGEWKIAEKLVVQH